MNIIGIDPGKTGGMAILTPDRKLTTYAFDNLTIQGFNRLFFTESLERCTAFLELVHSAPGQGVKSVFTFGRVRGWLEMALTAHHISFDEVTPQVWQRGVGVANIKGEKAERKKGYKQRAEQLFPGHNITLSTADAVLIAEFGYRTFYRGG